ncbi:MAG: DNA primase, partial [Proteobacteria bacterium]
RRLREVLETPSNSEPDPQSYSDMAPPPDDHEYGQFGGGVPSTYDDGYPYTDIAEPAEVESGFDAGFSDGVLMRALGLIALHPPAALLVADEMLPDDSDRTANLLREVVALVRETPDMSTAALLGYWTNTDEGEALSAAAAKEVIDTENEINEHLVAILNKLSRDRRVNLLRTRAQELKSVPYTELSNEQKRELVSLTTEIRQLSGRD